jgi:peptide/nickel transport system permease protein
VARYVVVRLYSMAVTLLGLSVLVFLMLRLIPGTVVEQMIGADAVVSAAMVEQLRAFFGLDRPWYEQYGRWLGSLAHGDLGTSWFGAYWDPLKKQLIGAEVGPMMLRAAGVTGSLVLGGMVLLALLSIPLGMLAASRPRTFLDRTLLVISLVAISTHPIVVGVVLQTLFANHWHFAPAFGYCSFFHPSGPAAPTSSPGIVNNSVTIPCAGGAKDWFTHLILPWITFALLFVALYMRMLRSSILDTLSAPFIQAARAKGAPERRVFGRHALPNAVLPVLTMLGMDMGTALGIAVYVETVYQLPGLGRLSLQALAGDAGFDLHMIVGLVLFVALFVIVLNLIVDLLYVVIDPRVEGVAARGRAAGRIV